MPSKEAGSTTTTSAPINEKNGDGEVDGGDPSSKKSRKDEAADGSSSNASPISIQSQGPSSGQMDSHAASNGKMTQNGHAPLPVKKHELEGTSKPLVAPAPIRSGWTIGPEQDRLLAYLDLSHQQLVGNYKVTKSKVVIGRESSTQPPDLVIEDNNYVSRGHLVLEWVADSGCWQLSCNGKNGVFLNDNMIKKGGPPVRMPLICTLRFPSTQVRLSFRNAIVPAAVSAPNPIQEHNDLPPPPSTKSTASSVDNTLFLRAVSCSTSATSPSLSLSEDRRHSVPAVPLFVVRANNDRSGTTMTNAPLTTANTSITTTNTHSDGLEDGLGDDVVDSGDSGAEDANGKPPYSYAQLIVQAIASAADQQSTLSGIYAYITKTYPWYRSCEKGWQNSIRHNLSLNRSFVRMPRGQDEQPGKGSFWRLEPGSQAKLIQAAFRKRRARCPVDKARSAPVSPGIIDVVGIDEQEVPVRPTCNGFASPQPHIAAAKSPPHFQLRPTGGLKSPSQHHQQQQAATAALLSMAAMGSSVPPLATPAMVHHHERSPFEHPSSFRPAVITDEAMTGKPTIGVDAKRTFNLSPVEIEKRNLVSQSAPCSPKPTSRDQEFHKRESHPSGTGSTGSGGSSGGGTQTFRVRSGAKDGRHRLQLVHQVPEFVPVARADVSALQQLSASQKSRSRSASLLQQYRGGSKSLSTTPVRELLALGAAQQQAQQQLARALIDSSPEPKVLKRSRPTTAEINGHSLPPPLPHPPPAVAPVPQPSMLLPITTVGSHQHHPGLILVRQQQPMAPSQLSQFAGMSGSGAYLPIAAAYPFLAAAAAGAVLGSYPSTGEQVFLPTSMGAAAISGVPTTVDGQPASKVARTSNM